MQLLHFNQFQLFCLQGLNDNKSALNQIIAWRLVHGSLYIYIYIIYAYII